MIAFRANVKRATEYFTGQTRAQFRLSGGVQPDSPAAAFRNAVQPDKNGTCNPKKIADYVTSIWTKPDTPNKCLLVWIHHFNKWAWDNEYKIVWSWAGTGDATLNFEATYIEEPVARMSADDPWAVLGFLGIPEETIGYRDPGGVRVARGSCDASILHQQIEKKQRQYGHYAEPILELQRVVEYALRTLRYQGDDKLRSVVWGW